MDASTRLVWLDLEMSGLNPQRDKILEIATVVTDSGLQTLATGPVLAIHQSAEVLADMDAWNQQTHGHSGLLARVQESPLTVDEAQAQTLNFLRTWVEPTSSPLCGNSVHQDRRFLNRYMPALADFFHYRNLDVSTLKILAQLWSAPQYQKPDQHEALADIRASIAELQYYRRHLLRGCF